MEIGDRKGTRNIDDDHLSRIASEDRVMAIPDTFPDEHLFAVIVKTPSGTNIVNYLVRGKFSTHFYENQKSKLKNDSRHYIGMILIYGRPVLI